MNLKLTAAFFGAMLFGMLQSSNGQNLSVTGSDDKSDWPAFRGPSMNNSAGVAGIFAPGRKYDLKVVWKQPLGSGYSGISIAAGLGVTMFSDSTFDFICAFNPDNGQRLWSFKIDTTYLGRFGSQNGPISTPVISEGTVYGLGPKGHLFALDGKTGQKLWLTNLPAEHSSLAPFYGYSTSPIIYNDVLIVQTGGANGNAVTGFNKNTGQPLWTAGVDTIQYQSPVLLSLQGRDQILCVGDRRLFSLDPRGGQLLWQHLYGGDVSDIGSGSMNPLMITESRIFLKNRRDGCALVELKAEGENWIPHELWKSKNIKGTYVPAIYHEGHIYGYNGRFLNCLDAATGESVWKSRTPGDGFPLLLDGHLVIITKDGTLSLAPASREGYYEMASLKLFDHLVWTPPSFARGKIYLRSHAEMACVEIVPAEKEMASVRGTSRGILPDSKFAQFVSRVENSENKKALLDEFMSSQKSLPVIEGKNMAHFVYRGEATDMALVGDVTGFRVEQPMNRIVDTDFFYYSTTLEPDARVAYRFTKNFQEQIPDPLNSTPSTRLTLFGESSILAMPEWVDAKHLQVQAEVASGKIDSLKFTSTITDSSRLLKVYLPPGYDDGNARHPVAFVHGGTDALTRGKMNVSLDNLIGKTVTPVIVVFIPPLHRGGYDEYNGALKETYARIFVEEILPLIDRTYRTIPAPESRANLGASFSAVTAFYLTFNHPDLFGKAGMQSIFWDLEEQRKHDALIARADNRKLRAYMDWGKYDLRSPLEGFDIRNASSSLFQLLRKKGLDINGGEVHQGYGWLSWRNRTDKIFEALFPMRTSNRVVK
jgi:outer membrane protein assembly factor BamB/enterochelin esterase-like enzyme